MYTAKHTMLMHHKNHKANIYVFFMDIRSSGKNYEQFVRRVSNEKIATYLRGRIAKIFPRNGKLVVRGAENPTTEYDTLEIVEVTPVAQVTYPPDHPMFGGPEASLGECNNGA